MPVTPRVSDTGPTQAFAAHAAAARWQDIPGAAQRATLRTVLNSVGCVLGGARHAAVETILDYAGPLSGAPVATVAGRTLRLDPARAALVNGLAGSVHAFDDTHARSIVHPGTPVTVAALAAVEAAGRSVGGAGLLNAVAWGLEITCRVSRAISPGMPMALSQTGTVAAIGAAVSAALMLGLDRRRLGHAIGIAAASASGIRAGHGTTTMHLLPARAASVGVEAALMAAAGCDSADEALAGRHGFFAAFGGDATAHGLFDDLGDRFELEANTFKPYPCGAVANPVIDACLALRQRLDGRAATATRIGLVVAPAAVALADRAQPRSELEAQVSLQHWAAVALLTGRAGLDEGDLPFVTGNAEIARLRGLCGIETDPSLGVEQARATLHMPDGAAETAMVEEALGSLANPMSDAQLDAKFAAQAARTLGEDRARKALAACRGLADADDAAAFVRGLAG